MRYALFAFILWVNKKRFSYLKLNLLMIMILLVLNKEKRVYYKATSLLFYAIGVNLLCKLLFVKCLQPQKCEQQIHRNEYV